MSAQQAELEEQQLGLEASIASLGAAIRTAQGVAGGAAAASTGSPAESSSGGLHCMVRPVALLPLAPSASSSDGQQQQLSVEVRLVNRGSLALTGSWSVLVTHSSVAASSSSTVVAAPLGGLPAGAAWRHECQVPLPGLHLPPGLLRVLLCRHGSGPASSSTLLLHSVRLDGLHLLQLGCCSMGHSGQQQQQQQQKPDGASAAPEAQARLLLQLPGSLCGPQPAAGELLRQFLDQGLSSSQQQVRQPAAQLSAAALAPAFSLLQQPPAPRSRIDGAAAGIALTAQLVQTSGAAAPCGEQQLQVSAAAADPAALLAGHAGLCRRALLAQAASSEPQQQLPWPRLPGNQVLLPPGAASGWPAAPAVDEAALEETLVQLRRLRAAAMAARHGASENGGQAPAEEQRRREQALGEARRLQLAVRLAPLPPVMLA